MVIRTVSKNVVIDGPQELHAAVDGLILRRRASFRLSPMRCKSRYIQKEKPARDPLLALSAILPLIIALLITLLQRRITLVLRPKLPIHPTLAREIAIKPQRALLNITVTALQNRHSKETSRWGRIRPIAVNDDGADVAVVVLPAVDSVAHGGEGVHVPFTPHVIEVVGAAESAVDAATPGEEVEAAGLLGVPGVVGVGAFVDV